MVRVAWVVAAVAALVGCKDHETSAQKIAPPSLPASAPKSVTGKLGAESAQFEYAVFFLPRPKSDPDKALAGACKALVAPFERVAKKEPAKTARPTLATSRGEDKAFHDTDDRLLDIASVELSLADRAALRQSAPALWLSVSARAPSLLAAVHRADELAACVARATGGVVYDFSTRQLFAREAWQRKRVESWKGEVPNAPAHLVNHVYADGDLVREVTLGLEKFGLPDLEVSDVPGTISDEIGIIVNLTAQALAQNDVVPPSGKVAIDPAKLIAGAALAEVSPGHHGEVTLAQAERQEGDADNRLLSIRFDAAPGATAQERQIAFVDAFGLRDEGGVLNVKHDPLLLAASARARKRLLALKPAFDAGLAPGDHLMVKAPFITSDDGNEWMWVEVTAWKGDKITGILMSQPDKVPDLRAGARVSVAASKVFDYMYEHGDAKEGNETEKLLRATAK